MISDDRCKVSNFTGYTDGVVIELLTQFTGSDIHFTDRTLRHRLQNCAVLFFTMLDHILHAYLHEWFSKPKIHVCIVQVHCVVCTIVGITLSRTYKDCKHLT